MRTHRGVRKIVNGKIKFFGKEYRPSEMHRKYNGELDGTKWYFIAYEPLDEQKTLAMWGDEQRYNASRLGGEAYKKYGAGLEANVIDGYIYWNFWKTN